MRLEFRPNLSFFEARMKRRRRTIDQERVRNENRSGENTNLTPFLTPQGAERFHQITLANITKRIWQIRQNTSIQNYSL